MELGKFTTEQLENVKHVMFGKQKQANVTNEAVVKLIAGDIASCYGTNSLDSEDSVKESIKHYLQDTIDGKFECNDIVVMLIVGEQSFNCLKGTVPKVVNVEQPNPESPKYLFRIYVLGEVPEAEVDSLAKMGAGPQFVSGNAIPDSKGETSLEIYDYKARVEKLVKDILPLVPEGVKKELSDPYQQCLCCAEYFYNL